MIYIWANIKPTRLLVKEFIFSATGKGMKGLYRILLNKGLALFTIITEITLKATLITIKKKAMVYFSMKPVEKNIQEVLRIISLMEKELFIFVLEMFMKAITRMEKETHTDAYIINLEVHMKGSGQKMKFRDGNFLNSFLYKG